jgi:two-component system chemotaxis response regulator CheB
MLVDDSAVIRGLLTRALKGEAAIEVTASVGDGLQAIERAKRGDIEVIVLDIEMPRMDGIEALPQLLKIDRDLQIVMASTLTQRNADISLKAIMLGAKDYLAKPSSSREMIGPADFNTELIARIKGFGQQRRRRRGERLPVNAAPPRSGTASAAGSGAGAGTGSAAGSATGSGAGAGAGLRDRSAGSAGVRAERASGASAATGGSRPSASARGPVTLLPARAGVPEAIAIGSSTGGPQALFEVLKTLSPTIRQPVFITQHMPATFTKILAEHIHTRTGWECGEGVDGEIVRGGRIYLAPGDNHMVVVKEGNTRKIRLNQDEPENFCRPAVDPMLRSLVKAYGSKLTVAILTGMGHDGREGGRHVVEAGGQIIAQDEASSVVWGMPGAVAEAGLCTALLPLVEIGPKLKSIATTGR